MNLTVQNKFQAKGASPPMKRNLFTKSTIVSVALSAVLAGCGSTSSSEEEVKQTSISGKAIDGYLQNAVVCLDLNDDGYCQSKNEPMTTTLSDGSFSLEIKDVHRANQNFDEAMLLVFGGKDVDTGVDFKGKLFAPNDGSAVLNISPITTLVAKNVQKSLKSEQKLTREQIQEQIKQARKKVADVLEISEEEVGLDPVAQHKNKGDDKLIRKSLKVQKSLEGLLVAAQVSDSKQKDKLDEAYDLLADSIDEMNGEKGLDRLFAKTTENERFKQAFKGEDSRQMLAVMDGISANLDKAFDEIAEGDDKLEKIAAVTHDDFEVLKTGSEAGKLGEAITGIVYLPDDARFKADFDWKKKYIENDLFALGIKPTSELIEKLEARYDGDIGAGVLFRDSEKLKESGDESIEAVYQRILKLKTSAQKEEEAEKARHDDVVKTDLKELLSNKTLYIAEEDYDGRKSSVEVHALVFNADASVVIDDENQETKLKIDGNNIYVEDDGEVDILTFKKEEKNYYAFYAENGEEVKFFLEADKAESFAKELEKKFQDKFDFFSTIKDDVASEETATQAVTVDVTHDYPKVETTITEADSNGMFDDVRVTIKE